MASAQVQRKQDHLEAGKKRLEEFRKKKAADRAKKASAAIPNNVTSETEIRNVQSAISNAVLPNEPSEAARAGNGIVEQRNLKENKHDKDIGKDGSSSDTSELVNNHKLNKSGDFSDLRRVASDAEMPTTSQSGFFMHQDNYPQPYSKKSSDTSYVNSLYGFDRFQATQSQQVGDYASKFVSSFTADNANYDDAVQSSWSNSATRGPNYETTKDMEDRKLSNNLLFPSHERKTFGDTFYGRQIDNNGEGQNFAASTKSSLSWDTEDKISLYKYTPEAQVRRSRPSFLDSLNLSTPTQRIDSHKETNTHSDVMVEKTPLLFQNHVPEKDTVDHSSSLKSNSASNISGNSVKLETQYDGKTNIFGTSEKIENESKQSNFISRRDDDFAALEQHIEDLTQEKFSLQRALDASQALAESLAAENSSMTDSYNQQRVMVNQLKADMETLQEEIKERLLDLEAVKIEYANAQLECNAADERAKLLASEVIGLEEKALRIRSNELKLERQLEELQSEINSQKKKISTLEKERNDMKNAIDAFHEEKKLLQTKLRKGLASKSVDFADMPTNKKDVSTDTEGIDATCGNFVNLENGLQSDSSASMAVDNAPLSFEKSHMSIPSDHMKIVQNINALISELAQEKEVLTHALSSQSSECTKLKNMNKELSKKLEAQTQRVELLTAQSMASGSVPLAQSDPQANEEEDGTFADEGDEVVDRVLQWIMKLFPGGPSKRRTSKLL